jgi:hypothetical protein
MNDGWSIRVTTIDGSGNPAIYQYFYVFEHDKDRAIELVRKQLTVYESDLVEVHEPSRLSLESRRIRPGQVKPK